jgi:hypothetical protein
MADNPVQLLRAHSRHAPFNARGLAAHVSALTDAAAMRPTNAAAGAAPPARARRLKRYNRQREPPGCPGPPAPAG